MTSAGHSEPAALVDIPGEFAGSPYRFKQADRYSSHSVILGMLAGDGQGRRVLDVGSAHGYLAAVWRARGFIVTGIEADPVLAKEASKYCDKMFAVDLDGPLPQFDHSFDALVFGDVLEHLKDPLTVLRKLCANLDRGGRVIVSLPNVANFYIRFHLLTGRFDYQDRGILDRTHLRFFTRQSFQKLLADAGLEILELTATPIPLPLIVPARYQGKIFAALHASSAWLARTWQTLFGYQFVALARKAGADEA